MLSFLSSSHLLASCSVYVSELVLRVVLEKWTLGLQMARLTDFSSYRLLWLQNLGSTCSRRIDLQVGQKTKMEQKWPVMD